MSDSQPPSNTSREPIDGDVLIDYDQAAPAAWRIHRYPGPPQLAVASQNDAVDLACAYARETRVDVWLSDAGGRRLLHAYRA